MTMKLLDLYLNESHFDLDALSDYPALKASDTITVYHGFRDLPDAIDAARKGVSGRVRASRVHSYEFDNNPKGLFVTTDAKTAIGFGSTVMEIVVRAGDLSSPVWPSGGYTVQGQMAQYFGRGPEGNVARRQKYRDTTTALTNDPETPEGIRTSDDPLMADTLMRNYEKQALFVGDLSPKGIAAWHINGERITNDEFLERYSDHGSTANDTKLFLPDEEFDGDTFAERLAVTLGGKPKEPDFIKDTLARIWENQFEGSTNKKYELVKNFDQWLWPKQYLPALRYMRELYRNKD